jgi:glycosyltransferase involved in cell wall biosynthesis
VETDGLVVHRVWTAAAGPTRLFWRQLSYLPSAFLTVVYGMSVARSRGFDIVFCSVPPPLYGLVGLGLSLCSRTQLVLDVRDPWPDSLEIAGRGAMVTLASAMLRPLMTLLYRRAAMIIAVSPGLGELLRQIHAMALRKLVLIPGAVEDAFFDEELRAKALARSRLLRTAWGLDGRRVVGYAGVLGLAQNLNVVLDAAKMVPADVTVVMVGEGAAKQALEARFRAENLDNVQIRPAVEVLEELMAVYYLFDLALVPLRRADLYHAALPLKAVELAALGRPLVAADYRQLREFLVGYEAASFFEPGSPEALARAVTAFFQGPEQIRASSSLGIHAERRLTWATRARELEETLGLLLSDLSR